MPIDNKVFLGEKTNEDGELELKCNFKGWIEEIDVDYGELGVNTELSITTSLGRDIPVPQGTDSTIFPYMPRTNANESKFAGVGTDAPVVLRFVNSGELVISIKNADADKLIGKIEIVYEK